MEVSSDRTAVAAPHSRTVPSAPDDEISASTNAQLGPSSRDPPDKAKHPPTMPPVASAHGANTRAFSTTRRVDTYDGCARSNDLDETIAVLRDLDKHNEPIEIAIEIIVRFVLSKCYYIGLRQVRIRELQDQLPEYPDAQDPLVGAISGFVGRCFERATYYLGIQQEFWPLSVYSNSEASRRSSRASITSSMVTPRMSPDSGLSSTHGLRFSAPMDVTRRRSMSLENTDAKGLQHTNVSHILGNIEEKDSGASRDVSPCARDIQQVVHASRAPDLSHGSSLCAQNAEANNASRPRSGRSRSDPFVAEGRGPIALESQCEVLDPTLGPRPCAASLSARELLVSDSVKGNVSQAKVQASLINQKAPASTPSTSRHRSVSSKECEVLNEVAAAGEAEALGTPFTLAPPADSTSPACVAQAPRRHSTGSNSSPSCRQRSTTDGKVRTDALLKPRRPDVSSAACDPQKELSPALYPIGGEDKSLRGTPVAPALLTAAPPSASPKQGVESPRRVRDIKKFGKQSRDEASSKQLQQRPSRPCTKQTEDGEPRLEQAPQQPNGLLRKEAPPLNDTCVHRVASCCTAGAQVEETVSDAIADCTQGNQLSNENSGFIGTMSCESIESRRQALHLRERVYTCRERLGWKDRISTLAREEVEDAITLQQCYRIGVGRGPVVVPKQKLHDSILPTESTGTTRGVGKTRHSEDNCGFCKLCPRVLKWKPLRQASLILPRLAPPPSIPPCIQLSRLTKPVAAEHKPVATRQKTGRNTSKQQKTSKYMGRVGCRDIRA